MINFMDKLKEGGLSKNESKAYIKLLEYKELNANELSKKISVDRSLTYAILNKLLEKGLISYKIKNSKKYFKASKPTNLLNNIREKEAILKDIIPLLEKIQRPIDDEYSIDIYEGKSGFRSWISLILKEKEYCAFGMTGKGYYELYEMPRIIKEIKEKKIKGRLIGYEKDNKKTKPFKLGFEYRYLPFKSAASTSIFGDYVSIHKICEKAVIIVIKNREVAESYRNLFEFLWSKAE